VEIGNNSPGIPTHRIPACQSQAHPSPKRISHLPQEKLPSLHQFYPSTAQPARLRAIQNPVKTAFEVGGGRTSRRFSQRAGMAVGKAGNVSLFVFFTSRTRDKFSTKALSDGLEIGLKHLKLYLCNVQWVFHPAQFAPLVLFENEMQYPKRG
jgi:hypothetical protein